MMRIIFKNISFVILKFKILP